MCRHFQYIGRANSAFPSIFQRIWKEILKNANVMVIICGSLISMMESQVLAYNSPLYGRRTAQIKLKQIPFKYYKDFYGQMSENMLIERYAVTEVGSYYSIIRAIAAGNSRLSDIARTLEIKATSLTKYPVLVCIYISQCELY